MHRLAVFAAVLLLGCAEHSEHADHATSSPYAGMESRDIKALSPQEIADLESGAGMGYAMVAELNEYPGPLHAIELADQLDLTDEQRLQTQALFDAMNGEATELGRQIIDLERQLDDLFASKIVNDEAAHELTDRIGRLDGELRFVHLRAHLRMRDMLTEHQIMEYIRLRGYDASGGHEHHEGMRHQ